jgi:hypothetical protein
VTDIQATGRAAMAAKLVTDEIKNEGATAKSDLLKQMLDLGVERIRVTGDDKTDLGTVSLASPDAKAKVTDPDAFAKWVQRQYPTEVETRVVVRPAFEAKLLAAATEAGDPVDISTGEVIPGVEIVPGEPYLSVRPTAAGRERMRETLRASGLLALTSGEVAE